MKTKFRSSVFPLPLDNIVPSAPRSGSTLSWSVCCKDNYKLSFVIFMRVLVSLGCANHGILNTSVTVISDFNCEPLLRIVTKTPNYLVTFLPLSLSWLLCHTEASFSAFHSPQKVTSRSLFKDVMESSRDFQLIKIAGHSPQWNLATFLPPHTAFGDI